MGRRHMLTAMFLLTAAAVVPGEASPSAPPGKDGQTDGAPRGVEIFRRAFWRHPSAEDRILHALRHEELDEEGRVSRWAWWIALEPGPSLRDWLLGRDSFGLEKADPAEAGEALTDAPEWFPPGSALSGFDCRRVPAGRLWVFVDAASGFLFATDSGLGFSPPAKTPTPPSLQNSGPAPAPGPALRP